MKKCKRINKKQDQELQNVINDSKSSGREVRRSQAVFLLWDKAPWHKGSKAQQFIKEDGNIETFDFPRAAPDENPQEHVWKNGRSKITHNEFIDNIDQATDKFVNYLNDTKFHYSFLGIKIKDGAGS